MKVDAKSVEKLQSSIKLGVNIEGKHFIHLPHFDRLKERDKLLVDSIERSRGEYTIEWLKLSEEPLVTKINGFDLRPYWTFLEAKPIIQTQIRNNKIDTHLLNSCQEKFKLYSLGTAFDLSDIINLHKIIEINEDLSLNTYPVIQDIAMKMLKSIAKGWFSDACSAPWCVMKHKDFKCENCANQYCSQQCLNEHIIRECIATHFI